MIIKGKKEEVLKCPHCGCDEYYVITVASGKGEICYKFDPENIESPDNTNMYDGIYLKELKSVFCGDCSKKIGIRVDQ
jgi:hypothetical protein